MELLEKNSYAKLLAPLSELPVNTLFVRSVLEHKVAGDVFVNDPHNTRTAYVVHRYGMSLLFGDCNNKTFNEQFREHALNTAHTRNRHEWMQASPPAWDPVLRSLFGDQLVNSAANTSKQETGIVELNTRVNFRFNPEKYPAHWQNQLPTGVTICRTDANAFNGMTGSVIPALFWDSVDDFLNNGVGFSLFYNGTLASTAYASFIHGKQLELGIETIEQFRGKGLAAMVCSALIDYCLENSYEPVWSCRLENTGSYLLAQKLGFVPVLEIPYYRLSN